MLLKVRKIINVKKKLNRKHITIPNKAKIKSGKLFHAYKSRASTLRVIEARLNISAQKKHRNILIIIQLTPPNYG